MHVGRRVIYLHPAFRWFFEDVNELPCADFLRLPQDVLGGDEFADLVQLRELKINRVIAHRDQPRPQTVDEIFVRAFLQERFRAFQRPRADDRRKCAFGLLGVLPDMRKIILNQRLQRLRRDAMHFVDAFVRDSVELGFQRAFVSR